jgi:transposase
VAKLITSARQTIALTQATPERRLDITQLLARWALVREQLTEVEARIAHLVEQCPEARILLSIPEISATCAATIVVELGTPADFQHPRQILKLAGMNLTGRQSGQTEGRRRQSKRGRPMLRRQLFLLAGRWCQPRGLYRPEYETMRARGVPGAKAVCSLARKLVPLLFRVVQTGESFDAARWRGQRHHTAAGQAA